MFARRTLTVQRAVVNVRFFGGLEKVFNYEHWFGTMTVRQKVGRTSVAWHESNEQLKSGARLAPSGRPKPRPNAE